MPERAQPDGTVLLVRVEPAACSFGEPLLELALERPGVEMDAEALERRLDLRQHRGHGVAVQLGQRVHVLTLVAVLRRLLAAADGVHGCPELLHLRAGVVVVVLALDLVPGQLEQSRDGVADRAVPGRGDGDRAGRVRRDHLDLDALPRLRPGGSEARPRAEDLAQRLAVPLARQPQVDEARPGHLPRARPPAARPPARPAPPRSPAAGACAHRPAAARRWSRTRRGPGRTGARARRRCPRALPVPVPGVRD